MNIPKSFGLNQSGIYCIKNIVNNKIYIGSSINIYYRLKRHYSELSRGIHSNTYLQNAYNLYGNNKFNVSFLLLCNKTDLTILEQFYIDFLNPEYNITKEVIRNTSSKESRKKISDTLIKQRDNGTLKYPKHINKMQSISIYDLNCNKINDYESQHAAGKGLELLYLGLLNSQSVINGVLHIKGKRKVPRYKNHLIYKKECLCQKHLIIPGNSKPILIKNVITGNSKIVINIKEASKFINCHNNTVEKALYKKRLIFNTYKISRYEEN